MPIPPPSPGLAHTHTDRENASHAEYENLKGKHANTLKEDENLIALLKEGKRTLVKTKLMKRFDEVDDRTCMPPPPPPPPFK